MAQDLSTYSEKYDIEVDSRFLDAFNIFTQKFAPADVNTKTKEFTTAEIFLAISRLLPMCSEIYESILVELLFDNDYQYRIADTFNLEYKWMVEEVL